MLKKPPVLLLPVETRTREFDAKLLLACFLAERGVRTVVGSRIVMHMNLAAMPRGVYLSKDFRFPICRIFRILKDFGCPVLAWDEEAVLFYSAREFHERRVAECAFTQVEEFFAWSEENRKMIETAPCYHGAPVHVSGNPRIDLLRPELRGVYDRDVEKLQNRFGRFILVNTNFGKLNSQVPSRTVREGRDPSVPDGKVNEYMKSAWEHRANIFEAFQNMIPTISQARPDRQIIIRPHPAESFDLWEKIAEKLPNVHVVHEGNVYPWILASDVMIHNGCTTGIEAFFLEAATISYQPVQSHKYDFTFSNSLSHETYTLQGLVDSIHEFCNGTRQPERTVNQIQAASRQFAALDGPLASERITDLICTYIQTYSSVKDVSSFRQLRGFVLATIRKYEKLFLGFIPNHKNSFGVNRQRFPDITKSEVESRIRIFSELLNRFDDIQLREIRKNIFEVYQVSNSINK